MSSRTIAAVIAGIVGIAATVLLFAYVRGIEAQVAAGDELVEVLIVNEPIAAGTTTGEMASRVRTGNVPARDVAEGALASLDQVDGWVVITDLVPGEQLLSARFAPADAATDGGGVDIPPALHQVTVQLDAYRVLGAMIAPGDTVAVFISLSDSPSDDLGDTTHLVLHKVLVTRLQLEQADALGSGRDFGDVAPTGRVLVTLAATAGEVERIVFGAEHGSLWLSLEPLEAPERGTSVRDRDNIFN